MSQLKTALEAGRFAVTAEMAPPKGCDFSEQIEVAQVLKDRVQGVNVTDTISSIAVQCPEAEAILKILSGGADITGPKKNDLGEVIMEGRLVRASKTGYTGDPTGWELFIDAKDAQWLWDRLIELGAKPTGLGARDTLRLEAGLPLYGHELGEDHVGNEIPIFAVSLARFAVSFKEEKGDFIAKDLLAAQKDRTEKRIVPIALVDRGVMRADMDIYSGDQHIGWVTSGTMVPYYVFEGDEPTEKTGKRSIGFAYIDRGITDGITIDVRGKRLKAKIVSKHMDQTGPKYGKAIV